MPIDKAPRLDTLATTVPTDEALVAQMTSADHKLATGFYDFGVFTVADWKAICPDLVALETLNFCTENFWSLSPHFRNRLRAPSSHCQLSKGGRREPREYKNA